jgi:undecaprenyl-diphosphatase
MTTRSERLGRWLSRWVAWLFAGTGALLLWVFVDITEDLFAPGENPGEAFAVDRAILTIVARARKPAFTHLMVDLTSLGSPLVLGLFTVVVSSMLLMARDRRGALQVLLTSVGAAVLVTPFKHLIARPRPDVVSHLVVVHGASYPSGHALGAAAVYVGAALVAARRWRDLGPGATTLGLGVVLSLAIACSRIYLGVHYPTDAAAGVCLGYAWAALAAWLARVGVRKAQLEKNLSEPLPKSDRLGE